MKVVHDIGEIRRLAEEMRRTGVRIGVVPTMGALHEGHLTLIREAVKRSDAVIVTVFVNPSQFGPGEDYERYPRDLLRDAALAEGAGATILFAPEAAAMYPAGFCTAVDVTGLDSVLEGRSRPGHFRGVATVVLKLLHLTGADCAVFGRKDAQQAVIVGRMLRDLNMETELVLVPTVREADGLALSSRNAYLTPKERAEAPVLHRSLLMAEERIRGGVRSAEAVIREMTAMITSESTGEIDYISVADAATLLELTGIPPRGEVLVSLAVRFGKTRLIDNVSIDRAPGPAQENNR